MIRSEKQILENGLKVIVHRDTSTPMVSVNVLYQVGSKDEHPERTGFAHLFEHLMFGGSIHAPEFDRPVQLAGGENNAFTNSDITNFYNIVPAENLETILWLESDRMLQLDFSPKSLDVQKKVVVEEFKETCLNQPYGDLWHRISALAYKKHPYRWPVIGLVPEHIQHATLDEVKSFFYKYYRPNNAILVIAGNTEYRKAFALAKKWFGDIPAGEMPYRNLPREDTQKEYRYEEVKANVPMPAINFAFHMPERTHPDYHAYDLLSDVLSHGPSSRLYRRLVKEDSVFNELDAFITGTIDPGLFIITGKPMDNIPLQEARKKLWHELIVLQEEAIKKTELEKLKNKAESNLVFAEISIIHKAINLAYFEMLGDADAVNRESQMYQKVTARDLQKIARATFRKENCSELIYLPKQ